MSAGKFSADAGFTLIELLVTIALVIVLATIAVPNFSALSERNRYVADYNQILSALHYARSEAVKARADITVAITKDPDEGVWVLSVEDEDDKQLRVARGSDSRVNVTSGTVTFNALGRKAGDCGEWAGCEISVTSGGASGAMTIMSTGRVESGNG